MEESVVDKFHQPNLRTVNNQFCVGVVVFVGTFLYLNKISDAVVRGLHS